MIGALLFAVLATFIATGFSEVEEKKEEKNRKISYRKDLWTSIKFIANSQRLRSLFLYSGVAWGIFCLMSTYRSSLLVDIGAPEQVITMIAAVLSLASAIGSKKQLQFHKFFRNKSLSVILFTITLSILGIGMIAILNISYEVTIWVLIVGFSLVSFAKGMSGILSTRYLGNFANEKIVTQIYAINAISRNVFRAMISFLGSYLLQITNTSNSMIVIGIILLITTLGLISYMKTRLGLKPTEYNVNEIFK